MNSFEDSPVVDTEPDFPGFPDDPQQRFGRTFWDFVFSLRLFLLFAFIVGSLVLLMLLGYVDPAVVSSIISEYYPAVLCVVLGYYVMRHILLDIYRPMYRLVFVSDHEDQMAALFRIPEARFRTMTQPGNPLLFKTPSGVPIYFATYIDIAGNEIGYGWCHMDKFEFVGADRLLFAQMKEDFQYLLERVMYLEGHGKVDAIISARNPMMAMANDMMVRFGLTGTRPSYFKSKSEEGDVE